MANLDAAESESQRDGIVRERIAEIGKRREHPRYQFFLHQVVDAIENRRKSTVDLPDL